MRADELKPCRGAQRVRTTEEQADARAQVDPRPVCQRRRAAEQPTLNPYHPQRFDHVSLPIPEDPGVAAGNVAQDRNIDLAGTDRLA